MVPRLLMEEVASLEKAGYQIQLTEVGNRIYIVIADYPLPVGKFNRVRSDILVYTTSMYPNIAFDMFWADKDLLLINNSVPKNAGVFEAHLSKNWRRFSIHPFQKKNWNPTTDSLTTYLTYIEQRLKSGI